MRGSRSRLLYAPVPALSASVTDHHSQTPLSSLLLGWLIVSRKLLATFLARIPAVCLRVRSQ